jgi:hypothetical protein
MGNLGFGFWGVVLSLGVGCSDSTSTQGEAVADEALGSVSSALTSSFEQRAQELVGLIAGRTPENTT